MIGSRHNSVTTVRNRSRRTRGVSLVELLVVITVVTAILGITGTLFHRLFQSEQISARAALLEVTTCRLANQFRRDLHAAREIHQGSSTDDDRPTLELTTDSKSAPKITYTAGQDRVLREVTGDGLTAMREVFRLPGCNIAFPDRTSDPDQSATRLVTLAIRRPHAPITSSVQASPPEFELTIDAELGHDLRLAEPFRQRASADDARKDAE